MTRLIIIRHGYSCGNKEKKFSGQLDVLLDQIGYKQADDICKYVIEKFKIDAVYSSDLRRAYDTVKPIAEALQLPINACKTLREVDVGKWQGILIDEVEKKYPESFSLYKRKPGIARFDGGESYSLLLDRVNPTIEKITRDNEGKTIVIGTHGGVIRVLLSKWMGIPLTSIENLPHVPNASVTVAEYNNGNFKLLQIGYNKFLADRTTEAGVK